MKHWTDKRWHRSGKQILHYGKDFCQANTEAGARIIRKAMVARDMLPWILGLLGALMAYLVFEAGK